jgi:DNA-binding transcriptional ArsR family regulator
MSLVSAFPNFAQIGFLIGEPARAAILAELLDGRALTAGGLASRAGVTAPTASSHLSKLARGGLLTIVAQGRHRYYRLAGPEVASTLEALAALTPVPATGSSFEWEALSGLRFARTCYGHLAGHLGIHLRDRLLLMDLIRCEGIEHRVTPAGECWFACLGVDLEAAGRARRSFARSCLDWSERRPHLAVGDALLDALFARRSIRQLRGERTLELTDPGRQDIAASLELVVPAPIAHSAAAPSTRS